MLCRLFRNSYMLRWHLSIQCSSTNMGILDSQKSMTYAAKNVTLEHPLYQFYKRFAFRSWTAYTHLHVPPVNFVIQLLNLLGECWNYYVHCILVWAATISFPWKLPYSNYFNVYLTKNWSLTSYLSQIIRQRFPKLTTRRLGTRGQSKWVHI